MSGRVRATVWEEELATLLQGEARGGEVVTKAGEREDRAEGVGGVVARGAQEIGPAAAARLTGVAVVEGLGEGERGQGVAEMVHRRTRVLLTPAVRGTGTRQGWRVTGKAAKVLAQRRGGTGAEAGQWRAAEAEWTPDEGSARGLEPVLRERAVAAGQGRQRWNAPERRTMVGAERREVEAQTAAGPEGAASEAEGKGGAPRVFRSGDEVRRGRRSEASARLEALLVTGEEALRLELARW